MSGHTPGPWASEKTGGEWFVNSDGPGLCVQVSLGRRGNKIDAANARLIAAAPDLLAELKILVEAVARLEGVEIPYPIAIPLGVALRASKAAIAKAEGR